MTRTAGLLSVTRSLVGVARDQQLSFLAAAIAYYAFVSVVPLLLVTLAVSSAVAGPVVAAGVLDTVGVLLSPQATGLVETALTSSAGRGGATVAGLAVLVWSSLRVFRGLDVAFARVYGVEAPVGFVEQIRDALLVLAAVGVGLVLTVAAGAALPLAAAPFSNAVRTVFLLGTLAVVFLPLYYVFPDRPMTLGAAAPGAVLAAGGWTLLGTGFGIYASRAAGFQLYGVIGGVLLALTWFYAGGLLLLVGAALNAVLADHGDRQLQQAGPRGERRPMSERESPDDDHDGDRGQTRDGDRDPDWPGDDGDAPADVSTVDPERVSYADLAELREDLEAFESEIEERTVHREELEADLERYVRRRQRRGHARGWGPYLVLLYGTAMTLGAFFLLDGPWAVLAMLVVWLSTLGLYALMLLVGAGLSAAGFPGRALDRLRDR